MMILSDTVKMMESPCYKERFRAEYFQTKIRAEKLFALIEKHKLGALDFTPSCPLALLQLQYASMKSYLAVLETRADVEQISLEEVRTDGN